MTNAQCDAMEGTSTGANGGSSNGGGSSNNDHLDWSDVRFWTYVGLGLAGLGCVIIIITQMVCCSRAQDTTSWMAVSMSQHPIPLSGAVLIINLATVACSITALVLDEWGRFSIGVKGQRATGHLVTGLVKMRGGSEVDMKDMEYMDCDMDKGGAYCPLFQVGGIVTLTCAILFAVFNLFTLAVRLSILPSHLHLTLPSATFISFVSGASSVLLWSLVFYLSFEDYVDALFGPGGPFDAITTVDYTYSYDVSMSLWLMVAAAGSSLLLLFITMVKFEEWKDTALFEQHSRRILPVAEEDRFNRPVSPSHRRGSASGGTGSVQMATVPRILQPSTAAAAAAVDQGQHVQLQPKDPSHANAHASSSARDNASDGGSNNNAGLNDRVSMNASVWSVPSAEGQTTKYNHSHSVKADSSSSSHSPSHANHIPRVEKESDDVVVTVASASTSQSQTVSPPSAATVETSTEGVQLHLRVIDHDQDGHGRDDHEVMISPSSPSSIPLPSQVDDEATSSSAASSDENERKDENEMTMNEEMAKMNAPDSGHQDESAHRHQQQQQHETEGDNRMEFHHSHQRPRTPMSKEGRRSPGTTADKSDPATNGRTNGRNPHASASKLTLPPLSARSARRRNATSHALSVPSPRDHSASPTPPSASSSSSIPPANSSRPLRVNVHRMSRSMMTTPATVATNGNKAGATNNSASTILAPRSVSYPALIFAPSPTTVLPTPRSLTPLRLARHRVTEFRLLQQLALKLGLESTSAAEEFVRTYGYTLEEALAIVDAEAESDETSMTAEEGQLHK